MSEAEVRDGEDEKERAVRMRWNHQYIINSTLKGEHLFLSGGALRLNWSAVLSKAFSERPIMRNISVGFPRVYYGCGQTSLGT